MSAREAAIRKRLNDKYPDDALERLVRSNYDYYSTHGDYLPELARLLLFERAELAAARERCPFCGHEWRRHDPEDGECDAHTDVPGQFGACKCGRDLGWMQERIAALSSAALADGEGET